MAFANSLSGLIAAARRSTSSATTSPTRRPSASSRPIARFTNVAAAGKTSGPADSAASAGVSADNIFQNFEQGRFELTNNPLDMAINGQGFFRL
jgi:flagellar hook protein FlgE